MVGLWCHKGYLWKMEVLDIYKELEDLKIFGCIFGNFLLLSLRLDGIRYNLYCYICQYCGYMFGYIGVLVHSVSYEWFIDRVWSWIWFWIGWVGLPNYSIARC